VLEVDDLEDDPIDFDVVAVLELVRGDQVRSAPSRAKSRCAEGHDSFRTWVRLKALAARDDAL